MWLAASGLDCANVTIVAVSGQMMILHSNYVVLSPYAYQNPQPIGAAAGAPKAAKKRKLVDRRASKGRKLRYHVQVSGVRIEQAAQFRLMQFSRFWDSLSRQSLHALRWRVRRISWWHSWLP